MAAVGSSITPCFASPPSQSLRATHSSHLAQQGVQRRLGEAWVAIQLNDSRLGAGQLGDDVARTSSGGALLLRMRGGGERPCNGACCCVQLTRKPQAQLAALTGVDSTALVTQRRRVTRADGTACVARQQTFKCDPDRHSCGARGDMHAPALLLLLAPPTWAAAASRATLQPAAQRNTHRKPAVALTGRGANAATLLVALPAANVAGFIVCGSMAM